MSPQPAPNPKTVRLTRGRHHDPSDGACAMELASMLAGERFSDTPRCVCPAIAAFVRGYNDNLPDDQRQDLFACVVALVTSEHRDLTLVRPRAERLLEWARAVQPRRRLPGRRPRFSHPTLRGNCEVAGAWTARATRRDPTVHAQTLQLVQTLAGSSAPAAPPRAGTMSPSR